MTRRVLVAAGLIATLAGGSAIALAQPPQAGPGMRGAPGPRRGAPLDMGLRGVDLTDTQREQVRSIMESHKAEFDAVRTRTRDAHRAFTEAGAGAAIDEAAIRAASTAVANAMADEAILNARVRAEVHGLLTPEQQEQLKQRRAEMEKRMQERQQRLKERRPGRR